jgi:hypothetical protein
VGWESGTWEHEKGDIRKKEREIREKKKEAIWKLEVVSYSLTDLQFVPK